MKTVKTITIQVIGASQLQTLAAALAPGAWSGSLALPALAVETARYYPPGTPGLNPTADSDFRDTANDKQSWHWTGKAAWDPQTQSILWVHSPHIETDRPWSTLLSRWDTRTDGFEAYQAPLGLKTVGHGFDNSCIAAGRRRLYKQVLFTAGNSMRDGQIYGLNIDAITSLRESAEFGVALVETIPAPVSGDFVAPGMDFHPNMGPLGSLVSFIKNQIRRFDLETQAWTTLASNLTPVNPLYKAQIHSLCHYNPNGDYIVCGGGAYDGAAEYSGAIWIVDAAGAVSKPDEAPFGISVSSAVDDYKCNFVAHPSLAKNICIRKTLEIWEFDKGRSAGSQWKKIDAIDPSVGSPFWACTVPDFGVIVVGFYLAAGASYIRVWKPIGPDFSAPTAPALAQPTAPSPTEVDLAWTNGTDPAVAGEVQSGLDKTRILRDGATLTEVAATGEAYQDLTVQANTSYQYQLHHLDKAANLGAPSALRTVITPALSGRKWTPGNYYWPQTPQTATSGLPNFSPIYSLPAFKGSGVAYLWGLLETSLGVYDFSRIVQNNNTLLANGKKQIIWFYDRNSSGPDTFNSLYLPSYLNTSDYGNPVGWSAGTTYNTGIVAKWWNVPVMDRIIALHQAMAAQFDEDPNIEAVILQVESAPAGVQNVTNSEYTAAKSETQLTRLIQAGAAAWTHTPVFISLNYIGETELQHLTAAAAAAGVGVFGPDFQPYGTSGILEYDIFTGVSGGIDYRGHIPRMLRYGDTTVSGIACASAAVDDQPLNRHALTHTFWRNVKPADPNAHPACCDWTTGIVPSVTANPDNCVTTLTPL